MRKAIPKEDEGHLVMLTRHNFNRSISSLEIQYQYLPNVSRSMCLPKKQKSMFPPKKKLAPHQASQGSLHSGHIFERLFFFFFLFFYLSEKYNRVVGESNLMSGKKMIFVMKQMELAARGTSFFTCSF